MAYENVVSTIPGAVASADLTAQQFRFVVINGETTVGLSADGGPADGVLQNNPDSGQAATVWSDGSTTKVVADVAVTAGSNVAVGASGGAAPATSGEYIIGRALTAAGAADEFITLQISKDGRLA